MGDAQGEADACQARTISSISMTSTRAYIEGHFGLVRLSRLGRDVPWVKA
jgi:hypothetical protein